MTGISSTASDTMSVGITQTQHFKVHGKISQSRQRVSCTTLFIVLFQILFLAACTAEEELTDEEPLSSAPGDAGFALVLPDVLTTNENGDALVFTLALKSLPTADVVVPVRSSNPAEGEIRITELVFPPDPEHWNKPQRVFVLGVDDGLDDGDVSYTAELLPAVSRDPAYNGRDPDDVSIINLAKTDNTPPANPGIEIFPESGITVSEDATTYRIQIRLKSLPTSDVIIQAASTDTSEATVGPDSLTFSPDNWDTEMAFTVTGVNDDVVDGDSPFNIALSSQSSDDDYNNRIIAAIPGINEDNDVVIPDPVAGLTITPTDGLRTSETGTQTTFTVVLNSLPASGVNVALTSTNTAEGTIDPAVLSFSATDWNAPKTATITGMDDTLVDGDTEFNIEVVVTSADAAYAALVIPSLVVTNLDNDVARTPGIIVDPVTALTTSEDGLTTDSFTLALNSAPTAPVTINISSSVTSEASVLPVTATFTDLNWELSQTIAVTGIDDNIIDGDVPYTITFGISSDDTNYSVMAIPALNATNLDNDIASITVTPDTPLTTSESGNNDNFSLVLDSEPSASVTITINSSNIDEATVSDSSITFDALNWNLPQNITVNGIDDNVVDGNTPYNITFGVTSTDTNYDGIAISPITGTNQDNETAGISIVSPDPITTSEAGAVDTFTIRLDSEPASTVTIGFSSDNIDEGTVSPVSFDFDAGNWNTPQIITVTGVDDTVLDGEIPYNINFSVTSTDANYDGSVINSLNAVNQDNESDIPPGITATPNSGLITSEAATTDTFTLMLNSAPSATVTIDISSSNINEATVSPLSVSFDNSNWNTARDITVTGVNDNIDDGDIPYTLDFSLASADTGYDALPVTSLDAINQDNDVAGISITSPDPLSTGEDGSTDSFSIVLDSEPVATVDISIASSNVDEGTVSASTISFTAGDWDTPQDVIVTGIDDTLSDGDTSYTIDLGVASTDTKYDAITISPRAAVNRDNELATADYTLFIEPGTLNISASEISGNGAAAIPLWGYSLTADFNNTQTPGPVIEAIVGQTVVIDIINDHIEAHSFVIEGLTTDVSEIIPGDTRRYSFTAAEAGVYRYGDGDIIGRNMGMNGAVVVRPAGAANVAWAGGPTFDQERTWVVSDLDSTWNDNPPANVTAPYNPNYFLINGQNGFAAKDDTATMIAGPVGDNVLVRIVNAGQYDQSLHFHAAHFSIISKDSNKVSTLADAPLVTTINVKRGSTAMIIYPIEKIGMFPVHVHSAQMETGNGVYLNGVMTMIVGQ